MQLVRVGSFFRVKLFKSLKKKIKCTSAVASVCAFGVFCVVCSCTDEFELLNKPPFACNLVPEIGRKSGIKTKRKET